MNVHFLCLEDFLDGGVPQMVGNPHIVVDYN